MKPINSLSIGIASDHAGYDLKETIKKYLAKQGVSVTDFGTNSTDSCDYPDFAHPLANAVEQGACEFGIAIFYCIEQVTESIVVTLKTNFVRLNVVNVSVIDCFNS